MYRRLLKKPLENKKSFFLFGPRGTGKTTWLKSQITDGLYIDLLSSDYFQDLSAKPSRLEGLIPTHHSSWIIIDEIQRIPELLNEVHRLIEEKQLPFILTGSSARSLKKKGTNLLAGRAITYHLYPLTASELDSDFALSTSLKTGHLPAIFSETNPTQYLKTYVHTYVREEVIQEGLTRHLSQFNRFLEIASFSQGSLLNVAEISREVGMDRMTIENYFTILEDLLIARRLPIFSKRAKRNLIKKSKFYFFDVGVFRAIRPMGPLDSPEEAEGASLETLVLQELLAINDYQELGYQLFFWRTQQGHEVDFILYGEKGIIAIEVKRSNRITTRDLRGLNLFKKDYPMATCYCLYGGLRKENINDIQLLPIKSFFSQLTTYLHNTKTI